MVKTLPTVERSTKIRFGKHTQEDQGENTIVLNASNTAIDGSQGGSLYIAPVRNDSEYASKPEIVLMMYNTNTKELVESGDPASSLISDVSLQGATRQGNVTANSMIFYNNTVAFVTSGNVGISNSLASHTLSVGSNLYVDDYGTNVLVVSGGVGITDTTTSTSATTGALKVAGGISTEENLNVGAVTKVLSATDSTSKTTGALIVTGGVGISKNIHALNANFEDVEADSVDITDTTLSYNQTTGALKVAGGLGVAGNVHCGNLTLTGNLTVTGNTTVINANNLIVQDPIIELGKGNASGLDTGIIMNNPLTGGNKGNVAMIYDFSTSNLEIGHTLKGATDSVIVMNTSNTLPVNINGTLGVTGTTTSSSKTTGAVTIGGGLGVVGDIHATHVNFEDVEADSVTITDNTTSTSATTGALKVVGGISTQENLNVGAVAKVLSATDASSKTTGALIVTGGVGISKNIHALHANFEDVEADSVNITDTTTSTNATTGALKVAGGISTQKNLNVGSNAHISSNLEVGTANLFVNTLTSNVGIGTKTPTELLDIAAVSGDHDAFIRLRSGSGGSPVTESGIKLTESTRYGWRIAHNANTDSLKIAHQDQNDAINGDNYMVFKSGGNIGIAEADPTSKLQVAGDVNITDTTESKLRTNGALIVAGGIGVASNVNTTNLHALGTTASASKTTGTVVVAGGVGISGALYGADANLENVEADSVTVTDTTVSSSKTTGALKVAGGLGVAGAIFGNTGNFDGNITVAGDLIVSGNTTSQGQNSLTVSDPTIEVGIGNVNGADLGIIMNNPLTGGNKGNVAIIYDFSASKLEIGHTLKSSADSVITMNTANTLAVNINGDLGVTGTTDASSKTTGALIVTGGLGVAKNIHALHANFEDVEADSVTITDNTTSDSATTGALKVVGGISTQENLNVGAVAKVISATDASSKTTGALIVTGGVGISKNIHALHANFEDVEADSVTITDTTTSDSATTGALKVVGGISTQENLNVGAVAKVISATDATSKTTGALIVTGGLGVAKNIHGKNVFVEDVVSNSVVILDTTTSDSATTGALKVVGGISTQENLNVGAVAKVISATDASSKTTGALIVTGGVGISKNIHALHANFEDVEADSVNITDTTVSSSKTTGALKVAGGLGVAANIHTSNIYAGYDADETSYLGRAAVGFAGETNHASFAHIDNNTAGNYALKQTEGGTTHVNAKAGQHIRLNINNSEKARVTGAGDLKVGSNVLYVDVSETSIGVNTASPEAKLHVVGNAYVSSTTDATTTTTGALIVAGGLGIAKKIVGQHANFEDVEADSVTVTDTTESKLRTNGALIVAGGIGVASNVNTTNLHALGTTSTLSKTTGTVIVAGGVGVSGNIHALHANFEDVEADSVTITDTTEATSSTTGALKAAGGVGIAKDVYVGERAYVTGGLITNTGGVGKKTYSYSADLGSGASIANATYVLDFTNHPFHAKVTAMLIESDDEISTLIFDVIGGFLGGGSNSAYVPALGQQSIISTSTMNTPWDSTIATSLTGTTVTIKPANACSGVVRFNIFVEYLSHETAGQLSSITNSGTSAGSGAFGY